MKKKSMFKMLFSLLLVFLASIFGGGGGVMFADAATGDLDGAGKSAAEGSSVSTNEGIADADFYTKQIDSRITKIRPMSTPIDQISRKINRHEKSNSVEVKYYSVGSLPIKTIVSEALVAQTSGSTVELKVSDDSMFTENDTIRVVGVKGYKADGATADNKDLMLIVSSLSSNNQPIVYAVNGKRNATSGYNNYLPAIAKDTVLIRMGKAAAEMDAQTTPHSIVPEPDTQYVQFFMAQVEQSIVDKMSAKEVDWNFSDLEEATIYDMKLAMESSFLFGVMSKTKSPNVNKKGQNIWTTGGIWWMAGKDIVVGTASGGETTISDNQFVDLSRTSFTGTGGGNKMKIAFCGSELLSSLAKMKTEHGRNQVIEKTDMWDLKFTKFESNFGTILAIHHELFDLHGKSKEGFLLDPEFLTKWTFEPFGRKVMELEKSGQKRADAVIIREASALTLTNPKAHARIVLAS